MAAHIKGAIFDLDGTLLDSMFVWERVGYDYLRSVGISPDEEVGSRTRPMSLTQAAEFFRAEYGLRAGDDEVIAGVTELVGRYYDEEIGLKPGAERLLAALGRRGVKICVATSSERWLAEAALRRNGLLDCFVSVFTCTEVGAGKDCPDIYFKALGALGTELRDTVVFEDALYAVQTAKRAGFRVAAVRDSYGADFQDELRRTADYYLDSLEDFEAFLTPV